MPPLAGNSDIAAKLLQLVTGHRGQSGIRLACSSHWSNHTHIRADYVQSGRASLKTHVAELLTKKLNSSNERLFSPADLAQIRKLIPAAAIERKDSAAESLNRRSIFTSSLLSRRSVRAGHWCRLHLRLECWRA